jgi:flagellar biosynthesis/type III secretory pathway M-ring protein FliF/YscJ
MGKVERLTVAVLVDAKALAESAKNGQPPLQTGAIERLVRDAIAADSTRGDRVSVMAVPLVAPLASGGGGSASDAVKTDPVQLVERVSRPLVNVAAVAALAFLLWRGISLLAAARGPAGGAGTPVPEGAAAALGNGAGEASVRNRLVAELSERPETAAHVVRAWMTEDGS